MKKLAVLPLAAALAVAAAGSGGASTQSPAAAGSALIKCGKTRTVGMSTILTGDAASLGLQQLRWAQFFVARYNKAHKTKIRLIPGDTQLNTAQALAVAHQFASNSSILALVGPAGSQEVQDTIAVYKKAGLAAVTGSATRVALTRSKPGKPRETPVGYFFRTVPNDDQQGARVASFINGTLKKKRIFIIDDEESYSQGLADQVQLLLKAKSGTTVSRDHVSQSASDFSSLITRIPSNTQVVYIPWQLAPKAQLFYNQLRAAGKSAIVFGSDGTFAPGTFSGAGSYVSAFPVDFNSGTLKAYARAHGGKDEAFGLPSYTATLVDATAIDMACADGTASRAEVRKDLLKVKIGKAPSLLGFPVRFLSKNVGAAQGAGDMSSPANFAVFHIVSGGKYVRVA
ncbi:MAG: branched-chain amino acid ABC transporter substrate-binding protein [Gaiellaceae bacterium]